MKKTIQTLRGIVQRLAPVKRWIAPLLLVAVAVFLGSTILSRTQNATPPLDAPGRGYNWDVETCPWNPWEKTFESGELQPGSTSGVLLGGAILVLLIVGSTAWVSWSSWGKYK